MTDDEIRRLQAQHWAKPASEYHQAGKFYETKPDIENLTALVPDRAFLLRVLSKTPYMGPLKKKVRTGKRGPVSLGNQYTDAHDRRRNLYRLLEEFPKASRLKEAARLNELASLVIATTPTKRKRFYALKSLVNRSELKLVSDSSLKRYLRSAARNVGETSGDV